MDWHRKHKEVNSGMRAGVPQPFILYLVMLVNCFLRVAIPVLLFKTVQNRKQLLKQFQLGKTVICQHQDCHFHQFPGTLMDRPGETTSQNSARRVWIWCVPTPCSGGAPGFLGEPSRSLAAGEQSWLYWSSSGKNDKGVRRRMEDS